MARYYPAALRTHSLVHFTRYDCTTHRCRDHTILYCTAPNHTQHESTRHQNSHSVAKPGYAVRIVALSSFSPGLALGAPALSDCADPSTIPRTARFQVEPRVQVENRSQLSSWNQSSSSRVADSTPRARDAVGGRPSAVVDAGSSCTSDVEIVVVEIVEVVSVELVIVDAESVARR